jgi:hypothetical protein
MKILFSAHRSRKKKSARRGINGVIIKIKYLIECDRLARIIMHHHEAFFSGNGKCHKTAAKTDWGTFQKAVRWKTWQLKNESISNY